MEDERGKCIPLKREDRYLKREKRIAEYDPDPESSRKKKKQINELERELEVCRNKCNELSVELEEKKMECVGFEAKLEELAQYKIMYNGLKQQMTCLEEDRRVVCQSENKAQEWIAYLSEGMKKMERDDREKFAELEVKIRDLESGKRRVEDENDSLKRRVTELGIELSRHKHEVEVEKVELDVRRTKYVELSMERSMLKMECSAISDTFEALMVRKIAVEDENEGLKKRLTELGIEFSGHKHEVEVDRGDREKYAELEIKIRDLESGKRRVEDENEGLKKRFTELGIELSRHKHEKIELQVQYRMTLDGLKQQMTCLEEDQRLVRQSENKAQLCIAYLSEEMKKMERYYREKYTELEIKVRDLESGKRRVEDENECLKKRFTELRIDFSRYKHDVEVERDVYRITCNRLKEQISEREKMAQRRIANLSEELKNKADNPDLEFEKRRTEAEIDVWKQRLEEFETEGVVRPKHEVELEKELDVYRSTCDAVPKELKEMEIYEKESHVSEVIESEPSGLQTEVSHNDEKDDRNKIKLQSEAYGADINGALVIHHHHQPHLGP